jgi:hypothetical protein
MRKVLMIGAAGVLAGLSSPAAAASSPATTGLKAAFETIVPVERVARVCRERCVDGYCRRVCTTRPDDNFGYVERRFHRRWEHRHRYRDRDEDRGVGLHLELR